MLLRSSSAIGRNVLYQVAKENFKTMRSSISSKMKGIAQIEREREREKIKDIVIHGVNGTNFIGGECSQIVLIHHTG